MKHTTTILTALLLAPLALHAIDYAACASKLKPLLQRQLAGAAKPAPVSASPASKEEPIRPLVFAAYYCWYPTGDHPRQPWLHWTYPSSQTNALSLKSRRPGEPPPNSAARPLIGLYDSADPAVAEWHARLAKAAGIDAFLVDWWDTHIGRTRMRSRSCAAGCRSRGSRHTKGIS